METFEWVLRKDIGGRKEQQDSGCVLVKDNILLAAVADGLGGHRGGALASQTVVEKIKETFSKESFPVKSPAVWMDKFCSQIHSAIVSKGEKQGSDPMTTIVFLLIQENRAYWFHVGDSRLYYFFSQSFKLRTQDHSQVQHLVNLGLVKEEEMGNHPEQNLLLRCLGGNDWQPDFGSDNFSEDKAILLCTDGFWEVFNKKEMSCLAYSKNLKKDATRAMNLAARRGGVRGDNLTFIVVRPSHNANAVLL